MNRRLTQVSTYARLGPASIARVAAYRLGLKSGRHPAQRLVAPVAQPPFFRVVDAPRQKTHPNHAWDDRLWWFGWHSAPLPDAPPDWFSNPFSNTAQPNATRDWWRIPDFGTGDIKGLWELSRMDWVVAWATTASCGDGPALERLNLWLADWAARNPPYKGPNWKCGQEASIRVMHLVVAAWVLGQDQRPEPGLVDLLRAHLQRIAPTMSYAIGQQNNHGTSEAAALFIGGCFLMGQDPRAEGWAHKGRRWLEERAATLIEPDGSFSQYSVTYHRVMLDTYSLAEAWRRHRGMPAFSNRLHARLMAATGWLRAMTDPETGDTPNIGANDGARLLQLTGTDYRDFRPSVQLAAALFQDEDAFGPGPWSAPQRWLDVPEGQRAAPLRSASFDDGGYHVLRTGRSMAVLRYPRFRYRPSQSDALHVDLWHNGTNLLRDAGTFSYNAEGAEWFAGTAAHNTIEFDGRDQMPRLGRFLFGDWLKAETVEPVLDDGVTASGAAAYIDPHGVRHHRAITLSADALICRDTITGSFEDACLRWRLAPCDWHIKGDTVRNGTYKIAIEFNGKPISPVLGTTVESRYYLQKTEIPELSVKVSRPGTLVTKIAF
ncbi:alginate lyase family protein [Sulfitobacter sp. F26204]|uniref:heparinase II/III family protein n=1 Tax=Sulfitobacter sp. F26204 TaxID=2996014 RepID=UPI00225E3BF2|nr:alginate lyase family protein [Sulfitobacter sp. F26204]MCX7559705.1 alginate lyase family protein [Sulfitobacter sp. F26204]